MALSIENDVSRSRWWQWVVGKTRKKVKMRVERKVFKTRFFQLTINKRHAMRKKAGKIHENIRKDHKMLPIFTTTFMCYMRVVCAGEGKIIYSQLNNRHSLLHIASSCMQAQWVHTKQKKFPLHHSQMEFGTWHIFLYICHQRGEWGGGKCHSSSKTNDERTWSEMVIMRSQISEFYAFLFTSCFTCHVEFPSRALCIEWEWQLVAS